MGPGFCQSILVKTKSPPLSDFELERLTLPLQPSGFERDRALELVGAVTFSMLTEPGDKMAGALTRIFGRRWLLESLIEGFDVEQIVRALRETGGLDELEFMFGEVEATLEDSRQRWLPRLSKQNLTCALEGSHAMGLKIILAEDELWPTGLDDLQDGKPLVLFCKGEPEILKDINRGISIVGSRQATGYGYQVVDSLLAELARERRPTVSGGAVGIDAAVHRASLRNLCPTVAVMAGGIDRPYPKANLELFDQICRSGLLLSELVPQVAPTRWRFLQRNRLIAALTPTTVVVEAGERSGTIRTANNALELNRELYAVPGSILSEQSMGANELIASSKATPLTNFGQLNDQKPQLELARYSRGEPSDLAKRCKDALRELVVGSEVEIARTAGLTKLEFYRAIGELHIAKQLRILRSTNGVRQYALKYAG